MGLIAAVCAQNASAAGWPDHPVKLVVPFPAGGPTDSAARVYAEALGRRLGQAIVVDNRPGASGAIAAGQFMNTPADGYTFMMMVTPTILAPHFFKTARFNPATDFASVTKIYDLPNVIAVNKNSLPDVSNLKSLFAKSKAAAQPLMYTSSGTGSSGHLSMELMKTNHLTNMQHVAYKGSAPAMNDTLGGVVPVIYADMVTALPQIKSGRLAAVAVGTPSRVKVLPDVPTMAEQGFDGYEASSWGGLVAPKNTPQDIIDRVSAESQQILASDELARRFEQIGVVPAYLNPAKTQELIQSDFTRWGKVVKDNRIGTE
ncbi:tripartite tricarboxylate transporter substrate binding protein [Comamonas sp. w2-DMI]|uniref:Bug family tripartite tricarboxylate transporter substrate binding protein n=1 Tax=Comamonas sp. w2-DMI TaxID=3126391 RepID=UPI0032E3FFCB